MKKFKKILSIFLTGLLVFNLMTITAFANDESDSFDVYLKGVAERFFNITGFEYGKEYQISNSFDVYNFDDEAYIQNRKLSFIISDNKIIGVLNIDNTNENYNSNYFEVSDVKLNNALKDSSNIAVGYKNDVFYILTNNSIVYMSNDLSNDILISDFDLTNILFSEISVENEYVYSPVHTRATLLFNKQLNVKHVSNVGDRCWAACVAMKVNYQKSKNLLTNTVYNAMYKKYNEKPVGSMQWYKRAYSYYGVSATYYEKGLGSGPVSNAINNNKPVHISVSNSNGSHAIIICGTTICDTYSTYIIDDPNIGSKVYQDISYSAMSNPDYFVYYGQHTYTKWHRSII